MVDEAPMRSFRSDNNAGLCPEALVALTAADDGGHEVGYGDDAYTERAVAAARELFGADASVWFVATGTAANGAATKRCLLSRCPVPFR
jgi:threonine aldolase